MPGGCPRGFDSESPYSIMFGPDKCGTTNKVHFILKHKNPKSGEYVEHHLKFPPSVPHDKLTHVYTAILKSDNELQILVDGEEKKKANFLTSDDFEPPPQEIPNPNYFELDQPDFEPIAAVGIEIWTMQDGILFDNVLIAKDEKFAASIRDTTWKPKFDAEKEKQKDEEAAATGSDGLAGFQKKVFELLYQVADISFLSEHKDKITDLIEKAEKQPNITIGVLVSIVVVILTLFFRIIFGGKKAKVVEKKPEPVAETSTTEGSSDEMKEETTEAESEGAAPPRRRQPRREN
ncbi:CALRETICULIN AND CALNEXIN [Salix koriyanagi]|uniref:CALRETICULIN AND CALNEXIN n=1 Tax=Salix koriyanagi TaxID=2511006 RepID=A0A9Q1AAG4_9ROSI|nr:CALRETICULIN AND CALNEXIN [Salix koriyanagi]